MATIVRVRRTSTLPERDTITGDEELIVRTDADGTQKVPYSALRADAEAVAIAALALKAPLASPVLTGAPTAPTPSLGTNNTRVQTAAGVLAEIAAGGTRLNVTAGGTGAVARTIQDKTRDFVSVRDFGAPATGAADAASAFQAAVDSVSSGAAVQVMVPAGTYRLDSDVVANGRNVLFVVQQGAALTGAGRLLCPGDWAVPFARRMYGAQAFAVGGQRGTSGQGALLIGGADPYEGQGGTYIAADGNGNWISVTSSRAQNPTELIVYGSHAQGRYQQVSGTSRVTRLTGASWTASFTQFWPGRVIALEGVNYLVQSRVDDSTLDLRTEAGGTFTWSDNATGVYHYVITDGMGTCAVSGAVITRSDGTPFMPYINPGYFRFYTSPDGVTWTQRTISSYQDESQYTASSAFGDGTYEYRWEADIGIQQLSALRVQKLAGDDEENVNLIARPDGYWLTTGVAGSGEYRRIVISSGEDASYDPRENITVQPNGTVTLGGDLGREALRVIYNEDARNRLEATGGEVGVAPALRALGEDTNVTLGLDAKGTGGVLVTQDFARTIFQMRGASSVTSWISADASAADAPAIAALGGSADIDIRFQPKGAGVVAVGGSPGTEALRVLNATTAANRFDMLGVGAGSAPALRALGSDTNVSMGLDCKGNGGLNVTQDFTRTIGRFAGPATGANYLSLNASVAGSPVSMSAVGSDTNIDIMLTPKGAGRLRLDYSFFSASVPANFSATHFFEVRDASGNLFRVPAMGSGW